MALLFLLVIPAQAGSVLILVLLSLDKRLPLGRAKWIPAFAGMTSQEQPIPTQPSP
jgi:hypothetical protein